METDEDSRSSTNSSGTSVSSNSNGPASPPQENDQSNDQTDLQNDVEHRSASSSRDSNSMQDAKEVLSRNQSMSPAIQQNESNENQLKSDEEEIELSDLEDDSKKAKKTSISHEDLSDISDLESSNGPSSPDFTDLRQKLDRQKQNGANIVNDAPESKNDEDELDFEDDEIREVSDSGAKRDHKIDPDVPKESEKAPIEDGEEKSDDEIEEGEELEEGEVTDGDDKRPEESEPKPVCRFFTRGQCTWGQSCRFLHPGTTDRGNYTMFDMIRPIPVPQQAPLIVPAYDYRNERPPIHHLPPHAAYGGPARGAIPPVADSESAWERGLRTAKEMMRKASKRKEQDMDFDEKKMNLSGPHDEVEKDPYYVRASPEGSPSYDRPAPRNSRYEYSPQAKYPRAAPQQVTAAHYEEDSFGRVPRYRELPPHRMPHYEDDELGKRRMVRSNREVIVEKADEWSDPWMRKSPGRRGGSPREKKRGRERSYSSHSSYSSSGTSRSRSSSDSSRSPSPSRRRRYDSNRSKERMVPRKPVRPKSRSPSLKRRHLSPQVRSRPIEKKAISPVVALKRKKPVSPPRQERVRVPHKKKRTESSSGSSSGGSESESSYSSSTSSSKGKKKREKIVVERKPVAKKVEMTKKRPSPPKMDEKEKAATSEKDSAAAKIKATRRDELLKQLRAVEDAIARKKSKIK